MKPADQAFLLKKTKQQQCITWVSTSTLLNFEHSKNYTKITDVFVSLSKDLFMNLYNQLSTLLFMVYT